MRVLLFITIVLSAQIASQSPAHAKRRLAFVVGVADYERGSGLDDLRSPAHDARAVRHLLGKVLRDRFETTLVTGDAVKDRMAFDAEFVRFIKRISPGDDVVVYFSGHGNHAPGIGNVLLLADAKSQAAHIGDLSAEEARALDSEQRRNRHYQEWLAENAVREAEIERAILDRKPAALVIIADACRLVATRDGSEIGCIRLPPQSAPAVHRLYSAGPGQVSLNAPEPIQFDGAAKDRSDRSEPRDKRRVKDNEEPTNSLFAKVLLSQLTVPGLDFDVMAREVRARVRQQSQRLGQAQIPEFSNGPRHSGFSFTPAGAPDHRDEICYTAATELNRMREALAGGSLGRDVLLQRRYELARCSAKTKAQIDAMLRLEALGTSARDSRAASRLPEFNPDDPVEYCEVHATSSHDPNGRRDVPIDGLRVFALRALGGDVPQAQTNRELDRLKDACEQTLLRRPHVARFNYQLARVHLTKALISAGDDKQSDLAFASAYFKRAADRGYAAAFNELAMLHVSGEYFRIDGADARRQPADRRRAAELLKRGAILNHVVAQYNLGMAYLSGDLGLEVSKSAASIEDPALRYAKAFEHLSRAAERGYVPATIVTSRLLFEGRGVHRSEGRAIELLEVAASKGSFEAMYWLGEWHRLGHDRDLSRAIIWYARAAEAGDGRAQAQLARMLSDGDGVPVPQRQAANRYWRLAALAGENQAQLRLAQLIRDGIVPFRPVVVGEADRGAFEIKSLLRSSFSRGNSTAGLELARLYRTGFPKDRPSKAIPKSPAKAVELLWQTIEKVREVDPASVHADPKIEARAAFELMSIYSAEKSKRGRSSIITDDQIERLGQDYGDGKRTHLVRLGALGPVRCANRNLADRWILIWNWQRSEPPTDAQFDWLERHYRCHEIEQQVARDQNRKAPKRKDTGITRRLRDTVRKLHRSARRRNSNGKLFVERMIEMVSTKPYDER